MNFLGLDAWQVDFVLKGRTPLIMHRDDYEKADVLERWRKEPRNKNRSKAGDDRSPPWTWLTYLHHDGTHVAMPADSIMTNLRNAAARVPLKGTKTYKELAAGGMIVGSEFCTFLNDGKQVSMADLQPLWDEDVEFFQHIEEARKLGFLLFGKRAKVGQAKHLRIRPKFVSWEVRGRLDVMVRELTMEVLEQFFLIGGGLGLGDWRPSAPKSPGMFGMYAATLKKAKAAKVA